MIASKRVPAANSRYVTVDDRRIHYLEAGIDNDSNEPPVVLLHGSGIDDAALSWKHTIEFVADDLGRHVYAPDWPGYGKSDDPAASTTEYYVEVLTGVLDALDLDRSALVGISMGASISLGYALDNSDRVSRLVLVDSYGLRDEVPGGTGSYLLANIPFANLFGRQFAGATVAGTRVAVGEFVHDPASLDDEFVAEVNERLRQPGAGKAFFSFMREEFQADGVRTDYSDRLDDLGVPTLLVHGAEDPLVPVEWSATAAQSIPGARLMVIKRCGHWPSRERPDVFNDVLSTFL